ncbi:MAG TPA: SRPBCC family protein [Roseiflexaceae bacterium]|nr:SRPBCC family protein [Roseiflexaceae bacterium]
MITIRRARRIAASPDAIFAALSDPQQLATLLPRVREIELLEQGQDQARIATHMAFGPFGDIRNEGQVRWLNGRELQFDSPKPVQVTSRWVLTPAEGGTDLEASLALDLGPLLGPLAAFIPAERVADVVGPDLDAALDAVSRRVTE